MYIYFNGTLSLNTRINIFRTLHLLVITFNSLYFMSLYLLFLFSQDNGAIMYEGNRYISMAQIVTSADQVVCECASVTDAVCTN